MKRFLAGLVVGIVVASVPVAFAEDMIHLVVNGQEVVFPEAPPQIINGYTVVPARPLAEALGAEVKWDEATRTVIVNDKVAETPVPEKPAAMVVVDGVTYYYIPIFRDNLETLFPGRKSGVGDGFLSLDGERIALPLYETTFKNVPIGYYDLSHLVESGLLTQGQIDAIYGT